jgi:hypothetical protein
MDEQTKNLCSSEQFDRTKVVYISAKIIGQEYEHFVLPITIDKLIYEMDICSSISKERQKTEYVNCLKYATYYTPKEVEMLCLKNPNKYRDWEHAVHSVICYRYHLLGKAIVIVDVDGNAKYIVDNLSVSSDQEYLVKYWNESTEAFINPPDGGEKYAGFALGFDNNRTLYNKDSITSFDYYREEQVHQWMVDARRCRRENNTECVDTIGFIDRSGKEWYALRFDMEASVRWGDQHSYIYSMLFSKIETNRIMEKADVLFFRSKNKRNRAYEWIMKDK